MDCDGSGSSGNEQQVLVNGERRERKNYHRHTPQQIQRLEAYFKMCPHPDESQRQNLCNELKLESAQVKFWFQNKRTQSRTQDERSSNILLRGENEKIKCENEALVEALRSVDCPTCGGPPLGKRERDNNLQTLRLENSELKEKRDKIAKFISNHNSNQSMGDPLASVRRQQIFNSRTLYGTGLYVPPTSQTMSLSEDELSQLFESAASAVEELKRLFDEEALWVKSSIDGSYVIDQDNYEKLAHMSRHFMTMSAHVESSKDVTIVPIEATKLFEMFIDSGKWKELFPTIVKNMETIHIRGFELPIKKNRYVLQVIREQLHIVSPLVQPREFVILRCCQKMDKGLWIIADVSHHIDSFGIPNASCYKRPSGCLIQALSNAHTKVTWIEHVEVDEKPAGMCGKLICGRSGYGANRWIVTLERMCERMALTSILNLPATDWSDAITTGEARRNVMKLGERMLRNFNEMLTMSGKVDCPEDSQTGVRVSIRNNTDTGIPAGLIVSAASSFPIPLSPFRVFNILRNMDIRQQWDVLSYGSVVSTIARISTGSSDTNYVSILRPTQQESIRMMMGQESSKNDMVMLQDCYIDALGGMLVYAPTDMITMQIAISGEVDPSRIPILPSGFIISSDGKRTTAAEEEDDGGTILTVAFQVLISSRTEMVMNEEVTEKSVETVSGLISATAERVRLVVSCPTSE